MIARRRWRRMSAGVLALLAWLTSARATEAATCTWTGAASNAWSVAANWDGCAGAHPIPQSGDDLTFPAGALNRSNVNDLIGLTVGRIVIEATTGEPAPYMIVGMGIGVTISVTFTGTTSGVGSFLLVPIAVMSRAVHIVQQGGPDAATLGNLDLGGHGTGSAGSAPPIDSTSVVATGGAIIIGGQVTGGTGGLLSKYGSADLVLSSANTYEGPTLIHEGTVALGANTALGIPGDFTLGGYTIVYSGGSVTVGPGLTVPEWFKTEAWPDVPTPPTFRLLTGASTLTAPMRDYETAFTVAAGATLDLSGPLTLERLIKNDAGTLILSNPGNAGGEGAPANPANFWFDTRLMDGVLRLGVGGAFPDSARLSSEAGTVFDLNDQTETIGSIDDVRGTIALGSGRLTIVQSIDSQIYGAIAGTGQLVKAGSHALAFVGSIPNTYTGLTYIAEGDLGLAKDVGVTAIRGPVMVVGTLTWWSSHQISDQSAISTSASGLVRMLPMRQEVISHVAGPGTIFLDAEARLAVGWTHVPMVFAGAITGRGTFRKEGAGTLTLTGVSVLTRDPYVAGSIEAAGGTLIVTGSVTGATNPADGVVVASGGVVGGTGFIGTLVSAGTYYVAVSAGIPPATGVLTTAVTTLGQNVTFVVELNGIVFGQDYDMLRVTDGLTLTNTSLSATLGFDPAPGVTLTIVDVQGPDPVVGKFKGLPDGSTLTIGGRQFRITYKGGDGNDVQLTALP